MSNENNTETKDEQEGDLLHRTVRHPLPLELVERDESYLKNLMVKIMLPVPIRELADITMALTARAKADGRIAVVNQAGDCIEIHSLPNDKGDSQSPDQKS